MTAYTQVRTATYNLKPDRDRIPLTGSEDYRINVLSGSAHVSFSDGEVKEVGRDGLTINGRRGEHVIFSSTGGAVHVWHGIPDHPNSGISRSPFPGQVEHPLERQDDPEPPGPPAVLKTKSEGGDPNVVEQQDQKQQPQSKSTRQKTAANPTVEDLPEVHSVPSKPKDARKPTRRAHTRKAKEVKQAAKPSSTTGTGAKSPARSAGATKRLTGETGRSQTKREARRTEPKPNVRKRNRKPERSR